MTTAPMQSSFIFTDFRWCLSTRPLYLHDLVWNLERLMMLSCMGDCSRREYCLHGWEHYKDAAACLSSVSRTLSRVMVLSVLCLYRARSSGGLAR